MHDLVSMQFFNLSSAQCRDKAREREAWEGSLFISGSAPAESVAIKTAVTAFCGPSSLLGTAASQP